MIKTCSAPRPLLITNRAGEQLVKYSEAKQRQVHGSRQAVVIIGGLRKDTVPQPYLLSFLSISSLEPPSIGSVRTRLPNHLTNSLAQFFTSCRDIDRLAVRKPSRCSRFRHVQEWQQRFTELGHTMTALVMRGLNSGDCFYKSSRSFLAHKERHSFD